MRFTSSALSSAQPASSIYSTSPAQPRSMSSYSSTLSCAYPSWPRRDSLHAIDSQSPPPSPALSSSSIVSSERPHYGYNYGLGASSYISDEDLYPEVFEEEKFELRSAFSSVLSSPLSASPSPAETLVTKHEVVEKEKLRREVAAPRRRRSSAKRTKSSTSARFVMAPIQERREA